MLDFSFIKEVHLHLGSFNVDLGKKQERQRVGVLLVIIALIFLVIAKGPYFPEIPFSNVISFVGVVLLLVGAILYIIEMAENNNTNQTLKQKVAQEGSNNHQNVAGRDIIYNINSDEKLNEPIDEVNSKETARMVALFKTSIKKELEERPGIRKHFLIIREFDVICWVYKVSNSPENRIYFEQAAKELEQEKEITTIVYY